MKNKIKNHLALFVTFISIAIIGNSQTFQWAVQFGKTGNIVARAMAVDISGNVYTTGFFTDTVDFDPNPSVDYLLAPAGGNAIFVSKLDNSGKFIWAKQLGGMGSDLGYSIAVDDQENVYTTGQFSGIADFDPGSGVYNLSSLPGGVDVFVSKLDANGDFVWAKKLGGAGFNQGLSIGLDNLGNVYTAGQYTAASDFDPDSNQVFLMTPAGGSDIFVSKLSASGNFVWAKSMGGSGTDQAQSLVITGSGYIYITGVFNGTADFDPSYNSSMLNSAGGHDVFVSKLNLSGNFIWAKQIGGTGAEQGRSINVDGNGDIYLTGYFTGTCDFDPGTTIMNLTSAGSSDIFVTKLDSSGGYSWAKKMGGLASDEGYAIDVDAAGNIYTAGFFYGGTADFNPDPLFTYTLPSSGGNEIFVSKLNASGNFVWAQQVGGDGSDNCRALAIDLNSNIYTAGYFDYKADFDPDGSNVFTLIPYGSTDAFVQKMSQGAVAGLDHFSTSEFSLYSLFPNPTTGVFTVSANHELKNVHIRVYNSVGQLIIEKNENNFLQYNIDLSEHISGIYFLEIQQPETISRLKFVKTGIN